MLIVYHNIVINLDRVSTFWMSDELESDDRERYYIKFAESNSAICDDDVNWLPFDRKEDRDKAFQGILFAFQEEKNVFCIVFNDKKEKEND